MLKGTGCLMDQNGLKKRCMYYFWQRNTYCISEHSVMLQRISVGKGTLGSYSEWMVSHHPNACNILCCMLLQHNSVNGPLSEIITSELKADWSLWVSASSLLFAMVVMKILLSLYKYLFPMKCTSHLVAIMRYFRQTTLFFLFLWTNSIRPVEKIGEHLILHRTNVAAVSLDK